MTTKQWAPAQIQDPVWAAISDANGRIWIDGEVVKEISNKITGCHSDQSGQFSGEQCSGLLEWTSTNQRHVLCPAYGPGTVTETTRKMGTKQHRFALGDSMTEWVSYEDSNGDTQFRKQLIHADAITISNVYYDTSGNAINASKPHEGSAPKPTDEYYKAKSGPSGVCGDGWAKRGIEELDFLTSEGSAPSRSNCSNTINR